ncbi:THUMP-like domain-containing protein [Actinomycetes bacterium M1A6_2h]
MSYTFTAQDVAYLAGAASDAALAEVDSFDLTAATHIADITRARNLFGDRAAALIETVRLRRKASGKLPSARNWLFTDDSLQQSTPELVASRRARRLVGRRVHDVTCSIGSELDSLRVCADIVVGSDLDRVRLAMARVNVPDVPVLCADALVPVTRGTVVVADPGRRSGGRRRHDPAALEPPLPDLVAAYQDRDIVIKCAPGLDFDRLGWDGEVEIVSLTGGVREACLWSPGLAGDGVRRRASVLAEDGSAWEVTDAEPDDIPESAPGRFLVDPDGAVVRAGLVRHFAARHGLWQVDPRIAYLTGDTLPSGIDGFEIVDRITFSEKGLRQALASHDCGSAEILVRGIDVDPAMLRPRLKLKGTRPMAVVITRIGRGAVAFVCNARARG